MRGSSGEKWYEGGATHREKGKRKKGDKSRKCKSGEKKVIAAKGQRVYPYTPPPFSAASHF